MRIDIIIATYNRSELLARTLKSIAAARMPPSVEATVAVVDNNSKDDTRAVVEAHSGLFGGRLVYLHESRQGKSHALNTGIRHTTGDLVGMIDDDEEMDAGWFEAVERMFGMPGVDFIGGPYMPNWSREAPPWFPDDYRGVIGWMDAGPDVVPYGRDYTGTFMGGNAVIARSVLDKVGLFSTAINRTQTALLSGEDRDMYLRLTAAGAKGFYVPDLKILHYIPPDRLTKAYFRRWCFWHGVSFARAEKVQAGLVPTIAGIPRWLFGAVVRRVLQHPAIFLGREPAHAFNAELAFWELAGAIYGRVWSGKGA